MRRPLRYSRTARAGACTLSLAAMMVLPGLGQTTASAAPATSTTTPIQHVVVIFGENVSFDHYFGTYPNPTNTSGNPFYPVQNTPAVDGLTPSSANGNMNFLVNNPNGVNPQRLDPTVPSQVVTCDQDHGYTDEQTAFDHGLMDKFTAVAAPYANGSKNPVSKAPCQASDVMNYYDGNTTTALWNYAQHFAMSDRSFGTTFGPSTPGALNLVAGSTGGVDPTRLIRGSGVANGDVVPDGKGGYTLINDAQPYFDDCSTRNAAALTGQNVGDQLNAAGISWGWFQGGFRSDTPWTGNSATTSVGLYVPASTSKYPTTPPVPPVTCTSSHNVGSAIGGTGSTGAKPYGTKGDYIAHHEPFQYYASTANPHHLAPASLASIGTDTATPGTFNTANHQYDSSDFDSLVSSIQQGQLSPDHLPAVSFLKAPGYQDGHAAYSDPLDEQAFVTREINALQQTPDWGSTAVVLAYDDSDGFYDHVYPGVKNPSQTSADTLTAPGQCGTGTPILAGQQGRCGYGPRLPLLVISPYAKGNFVGHSVSDQSSILKFVQGNWKLPHIAGSAANVAGSLDNLFNFRQVPAGKLFLDSVTGEPSLPPPTLPETPWPVLFGVSAAFIGGGFLFLRRRQALRQLPDQTG